MKTLEEFFEEHQDLKKVVDEKMADKEYVKNLVSSISVHDLIPCSCGDLFPDDHPSFRSIIETGACENCAMMAGG